MDSFPQRVSRILQSGLHAVRLRPRDEYREGFCVLGTGQAHRGAGPHGARGHQDSATLRGHAPLEGQALLLSSKCWSIYVYRCAACKLSKDIILCCARLSYVVYRFHFLPSDDVILCCPVFLFHRYDFLPSRFLNFFEFDLNFSPPKCDMWMRSSLVVRASDCQCKRCNSPGFNPSIHRHSLI